LPNMWRASRNATAFSETPVFPTHKEVSRNAVLFLVQYQADSESSILMAFAKLLRMRLNESASPPISSLLLL
jgi:hypothetical protein